MTFVHIYRAEPQPATKFVLWIDVDRPLWFKHKPAELLWCDSCGRKRPAKDLNAFPYYDMTVYACREKEHGRSPRFPFEYADVCKGTAFKPGCQKDSP